MNRKSVIFLYVNRKILRDTVITVLFRFLNIFVTFHGPFPFHKKNPLKSWRPMAMDVDVLPRLSGTTYETAVSYACDIPARIFDIIYAYDYIFLCIHI